MIGLVLWFNPDPGVGMIWCEDQGPLAFLGPEVRLPEGSGSLGCGDQVVFDFVLCEGVRYVRDVVGHTAAKGGRDPQEIIADYLRRREVERNLRVVA